jgi:hypothetical protein
MTGDPLSPRLLPPDTGSADLVLPVADGAPRDPLARQGRRPLRALLGAVRALLWHRLGLAFLALFAVLVAGFGLLATVGGFSAGNALYLTFLDAAGAAVSDPALSTPEKAAQFLLTFAGMAFIPVVTAAVVSARLTGSLHGKDRPMSQHVIVAGLGNVGTRIVGQLHDLGVGVVCVDKSEGAAGIPMARRLGLRVARAGWTGHRATRAPSRRRTGSTSSPLRPACPRCSRAASPRGIDCRSFAFSLPYFAFFAG